MIFRCALIPRSGSYRLSLAGGELFTHVLILEIHAMITVCVPTFDEFNHYAFVRFVRVKIKNKPDYKDVNKITRLLPGIPQGGVGPEPLADLLASGRKDVREFYDARQRTRPLRGYFVEIEQR